MGDSDNPGAFPYLAPLLQAAADPRRALTQLAQKGHPILGLQCPLLPEELPWALGLFPWRLRVDPTPPLQGTALLQGFACSWVQSLLDQALTGAYSHLCGITFSGNTCDSVQNLPDIWRRKVAAPAPDQLYSFRFPARSSGAAAFEMLLAELELWREWLEQRSGQRLSAAALAASARLYNALRVACRSLQALARAGRLSYALFYQLVLGSQVIHRQQALDLLGRLRQELEERDREEPGNGAGHDQRASSPTRSVSVLLVGGLLDTPRLSSWLEAHGARCVADELCGLAPTFESAADLDLADPWRDMAARHLRRSPCAVRAGSGLDRRARLLDQVLQLGVDGVIFVPFRGCEPHCFDNVLLAEALTARQIPHLIMEVEPSLSNWGQVTTRLEAFLEMLAPEDALW